MLASSSMRALHSLTFVGMSLLFTQCSQTARVPERIPLLSIAIVEDGATYRDSNSHFHVAVTNISNEPLHLFFGGSGIDDRLSFNLIGQDGKVRWVTQVRLAYLPRPSGIRYRELHPREKVILKVRFGDLRAWEGFPRPQKKAVTVTMMAELEYGQRKDLSLLLASWTDSVVSKPKEFTFYPQAPLRASPSPLHR